MTMSPFRRPPAAMSLGRVIVPAALLLVLVGSWMAYYNARLTGDPMTLPYQAHSQRYAYTPVFLWQKPRPAPEYPNQAFRDFYLGWQAEGYLEQQSLSEAFRRKRENLYFYATPLLLVPLVTLPWMLRSRRTRFAAGTVLLVFAASLGVSGTHAHYIAPVAPLIFLLVVQGLRQVNLFAWRGRVVGPALVAALLLLHLAIFAAAIPLYAAQEVPAWALQRDRIRAKLEGMPDRHLVSSNTRPAIRPTKNGSQTRPTSMGRRSSGPVPSAGRRTANSWSISPVGESGRCARTPPSPP